MKIGIVTYHRTLNYGAVMQSLATRFVLEEMGHEVYYVDYLPSHIKDSYKIFSYSRFKNATFRRKFGILRSLLRDFASKKRRKDEFRIFFKKYVYPYCRPVDESYGVVIYGSDQIWRKQKPFGKYDVFYFGKNEIKTSHGISYAASMGILPDNDADKEKVKKLVSHLEKISVREEGLQRLLQSLGFADVTLSLDPTLLLTSEQWDIHLPTEKYRGDKYALVYIMGGNAFDIKAIKKFADSKGLKMIVLRGYATTKETETNITSAGPLEFVRLIKNAEYVFSASFHGLAFSIIYGKQFFTSFNSNAGRAESLLNQLEIKGRLLPPKSSIPQDVPPIDYKEVRGRLESLRQDSLSFLKSI